MEHADNTVAALLTFQLLCVTLWSACVLKLSLTILITAVGGCASSSSTSKCDFEQRMSQQCIAQSAFQLMIKPISPLSEKV